MLFNNTTKLSCRWLAVLWLLLSTLAWAQQSICYGTTANGRLERGVKLPPAGANFVSYSPVAQLLGRTYVHSAVRDIMLAAYQTLADVQPNKVFKYAETGFQSGGQFRPHKTHRNGLSVDFMVPVVDQNGQSVHLPTYAANRFGYNIEFDAQGHYRNYRIDYEAMAAHITLLHKAAVSQGYDLWRVIFDPALQPTLLATRYGEYLASHVQFSKKRSWVRHDEHYHIDFLVPCQALP